jgi:hypothetical protein
VIVTLLGQIALDPRLADAERPRQQHAPVAAQLRGQQRQQRLALAPWLRLLSAESRHLRALPMLANVEAWGLDGERSVALAGALTLVSGPLIASSDRDRLELQPLFGPRHTLARPNLEARLAGWRAETKRRGIALSGTIVQAMAGNFALPRGRIAATLDLALRLAADENVELTLAVLERAARAQLEGSASTTTAPRRT